MHSINGFAKAKKCEVKKNINSCDEKNNVSVYKR